MTKGEKMLVDLGYKKSFHDFTHEDNEDRYIAFLSSREISISEYRLSLKEIQAIHQCCVDYGWIESE